MAPTSQTHIVKAFAVHDGKYYPLTPRRDHERNGLFYLGAAEAGAVAVDPDWHASALELLDTFAPNLGDHMDESGETSSGAGGESLRTPWYVVFEYGNDGQGGAGELWVGRFFTEGTTETSETGVFVIPDDLAPMQPDDRPVLSSRRADRSVILAGQSAAAGNARGSNHGGESNVRLEW